MGDVVDFLKIKRLKPAPKTSCSIATPPPSSTTDIMGVPPEFANHPKDLITWQHTCGSFAFMPTYRKRGGVLAAGDDDYEKMCKGKIKPKLVFICLGCGDVLNPTIDMHEG